MIYDPDSPTYKYAFPDAEPPPLDLGAAATPSPAPPDALAIAVAAVRAERDDRKAMKREDRYGELTPSQLLDGASWRPTHGKPHYYTKIHIGAEHITLNSFSDAEKEKAVKLWKAVQDAKPTSFTSQRKRKAEREAQHAAKRATDVETYGNGFQLERDVLNANKKALTKDGVLVFLVLMLQTVADALVRIASMPKDTYLRVQEKTCGKIQVYNGQRLYQFDHVTGYGNCLMVFQCQADNATFVAYGDDVEEAFKTRDSAHLTITISKNDVKRSGRKKGEPYVKKMPWLIYLGKGDEAYVKLQQWLVEQCEKRMLPVCTIAEANSELGKDSAKEQASIEAHIQAEHGGVVPHDDPRWKELPQHWQDNKHIYMLTEKRGDVVACPEHSAQGKTDIYVYLKAYDYKRRQTWQYKPATLFSGANGLHVNMRTASGTIKRKRQGSNTYKDGDNDFYCAARIDGNVVHYWTFTNAEMLKHSYIGESAPEGFIVYRKDKRAKSKKKHAWTWRKHRSAVIPSTLEP